MVHGLFQVKVEIVRLWNDFNLVFMDLNKDQEDFLDSDSVDMIWYPWLEYINIPRKVESENSTIQTNKAESLLDANIAKFLFT